MGNKTGSWPGFLPDAITDAVVVAYNHGSGISAIFIDRRQRGHV
jgi:hypothetical protein